MLEIKNRWTGKLSDPESKKPFEINLEYEITLICSAK